MSAEIIHLLTNVTAKVKDLQAERDACMARAKKAEAALAAYKKDMTVKLNRSEVERKDLRNKLARLDV